MPQCLKDAPRMECGVSGTVANLILTKSGHSAGAGLVA